MIEHIRQVGALLSAMGAPCIVLADEQSAGRERIAGRVPADGSQGLSAGQWRNVTASSRPRNGWPRILDSTSSFIRTSPRSSRLRPNVDLLRCDLRFGIGLCLDTGHCYYGGGDPAEEAEKYRGILRYLHIKDIDAAVLVDCHRRELDFNQAVEAGVFTPIGEGCVDFPAFFTRVAANRYRGWCVVEQDVKFGVSAVIPKESMGASLQYLRGVV